MMENIYFITGIDTECGKTMITGLMAKYLFMNNAKVITQKLVQTGSTDTPEDIVTHRTIMRQGLYPEDENKTTCPYVLSYPSSPHLAAELEGRDIELNHIDSCTRILTEKFHSVLIEGAGGIMAPITREVSTLDYIKDRNYPVILVTSSRLGSINHTLLSLEVCKANRIALKAVVYNNFLNEKGRIAEDSKQLLATLLEKYYPTCAFIEVPFFTVEKPPFIDFSEALI